MGVSDRVPDPYASLRASAPRTGPGVPNMGGMPAQPNAPQRTNLPDQPSLRTAPPGPVPGASVQPTAPGALPPVPPMPPGYDPNKLASTVAPPPPPPPGPVPGGAVGAMHAAAPPAAMPAAQPAAPAPAPQAAPAQPEAPATWPPSAQPTMPVPESLAPISRVDYTPTVDQLRAVGPGQSLGTPHGDIYRDAGTGALRMRLNDVGKAAWQAARMQSVAKFGKYPGHDDPAAPPPPIEPGAPMFNPFAPAGQEWVK